MLYLVIAKKDNNTIIKTNWNAYKNGDKIVISMLSPKYFQHKHEWDSLNKFFNGIQK